MAAEIRSFLGLKKMQAFRHTDTLSLSRSLSLISFQLSVRVCVCTTEESCRTWCIRLIALAARPYTRSILTMYHQRTKHSSTPLANIYSHAVIRKPPTHPDLPHQPTEALAPTLRETPSNKELQRAARRLFWAAADRPAMVSGTVLHFSVRV